MINQPRSRSCLDCPIVLERGATDVSVSSLRCGPVADALTKQDHVSTTLALYTSACSLHIVFELLAIAQDALRISASEPHGAHKIYTDLGQYVSRRLTQVRRLIPTANARTYVSSLENRQFLVLDNCARDSLMDSSKAEGVSIQSGRTGACMFQVCGYLSGMSSASAKASRPGEAAGGLRVECGATSLDKNG
ncbi:hypothetical protein HBI47_171940 [Parastagonospora nodorum]|nr:hypothetical protein HBI47_171940 [Parastagonospora nodorum]